MEVDPEYFTSYEDLEIHELMLNDKPRQDAFQKAILSNKEYFNDKIVLDVGSGTAILSVRLLYATSCSRIILIFYFRSLRPKLVQKKFLQ